MTQEIFTWGKFSHRGICEKFSHGVQTQKFSHGANFHMGGFYNTPEWAKLRASIRAEWKRTGKPCGICGEAIRWNEKPVVDHIKSRRKHPELSLVRENLRLVCHRCNTLAGRNDRSTIAQTGADGFPVGWSDG
ncbi:MAG: HNH endonuclease signature motif containing protein [Burkholderiaceae bacterium]